MTRWPNLLFIAITQLLFHFCILAPNIQLTGLHPLVQDKHLWLLITASVCIAAGGNIINDYFDINIDRINKPHKLVVDKFITRRWVIFWHLVLSAAGIVCSVYVGMRLSHFWIGLANTICVLLLFIYSASLKKKFLVGNIVISALTAWTILVLLLPEYIMLVPAGNAVDVYDKIFRLGILYAGFSFIISLVREVIKDMEDVEGDRRNGCKTMPIVWGYNASKVFVAVWLIVLIAILIVAQIYVIHFGWWLSISYAAITLIIPLIVIFIKLFTANSQKDFHQLSSYVKWVMLAGILSMFFFWVYR